MMGRYGRLLLAGAMLMGIAGTAAAARAAKDTGPELQYGLVEGKNINAFVRQGPVAAHMLLRNGADPRILVAFPAGNSGTGLWFDRVTTDARWRLEQAPRPVRLKDAKGRPLYGITAVASVTATRLAVKQAVLSNVRFLRDYESVGRFPAEVATAPRQTNDGMVWARDRVDGVPGYRLEVHVLAGKIDHGKISAAAGAPIRLRIVAASGDRPLTGLSEAELLNAHAAPQKEARHALSFLSYREKFLAGSWRFNTYFGRDTLMSVRLLMPALKDAPIQAGLQSVLARLNAAGEVAHEEGLSEFAILDHRQHGQPDTDAPTLDFGMVDDDYMLGAVAADYLIDHADRTTARAFLARPLTSLAQPGERASVGALLVRNLRFVLAQTQPFADRPDAGHLIAIKPGRMTGQWRDSEEGLGRGRYAYDVNAALVPAALAGAAKLYRAGLLTPYLQPADRAAFAKAAASADVWRAHAAALFRVEVPAARAGEQIRDYAGTLGIAPGPALDALGSSPLVFHALSLDAAGRPVPILNSDEGFVLLFGQPSTDDLRTYVAAVMRPFPAGLMTDAGLLVANPALAGATVQGRFTPAAYHGTVVWSWQQALLAAGLERQLARTDLPHDVRATLLGAQTQLWRVIEATRAMQSSELWSWAYDNGAYRVVPFGAGKQDADESNAAQLWSTVYLAVRPPRDLNPSRKRR